MSVARKRMAISVESYLNCELVSHVKHEFLDGFVCAMAGANNRHNKIKGNIFAAFHFSLRGKPCQPFDSDTKIRIRKGDRTWFYYPDVSVVCRQNADSESYQDEPVVIVEVLSRSTRRIDEAEKKEAYLTVPSMAVYLLVEQESAAIHAYRRGPEGFVAETYEGVETVVPLPEIGIEFALFEAYNGVTFDPEPDKESV